MGEKRDQQEKLQPSGSNKINGESEQGTKNRRGKIGNPRKKSDFFIKFVKKRHIIKNGIYCRKKRKEKLKKKRK